MWTSLSTLKTCSDFFFFLCNEKKKKGKIFFSFMTSFVDIFKRKKQEWRNVFSFTTSFMHLFRRKMKDFVHIHIAFLVHYYISFWIFVKELLSSVSSTAGTVHYIQSHVISKWMGFTLERKIFVPKKIFAKEYIYINAYHYSLIASNSNSSAYCYKD